MVVGAPEVAEGGDDGEAEGVVEVEEEGCVSWVGNLRKWCIWRWRGRCACVCMCVSVCVRKKKERIGRKGLYDAAGVNK